MAVVRPFRGILYDAAVVGSIASVVAPPYDVVGPEEQNRLYEASPFNVIRLDLSRESDRYGSASRTFAQWCAQGALARDRAPAFYVYVQRYRLKDSEERERFGFFTRLRLEEFASGKVLPHEKTLASAKADRLALQRACRANLSSIFGLYSAPGFSLAEAARGTLGASPWTDFADVASVRHRLWRLTDEGIQRALERRLEARTVYIADGHHRYETALRYRDEMRAATGRRGGQEPFDYVLAYLVNMDEPGLVILPTHRLLRELPIAARPLIERLRRSFRVEEVPRSDGRNAFVARLRCGAGERRIGMVLRGQDRFFVLVTRDGENDERLAGSTALRRLDVTLLHGLVLEGAGSILALDAHREAEAGRLVYSKDEDEAVGRVESGEFAAAFLLNPTGVDEVRAVAEAGETMPEKSTYFYPKIATGLVFNSLED
ncbi:MAG TPA: DUF1015 domain-containing protein, partial [Candidatus Binatia bacterium]|nr:DUF1015 domain-containing protein [Candidatus Binatia bacterium]